MRNEWVSCSQAVAVVSTTFVKLTIACVNCESTSSAIVITSGNSKRKSFVALFGVPQPVFDDIVGTTVQ
jgi:hypothetical protein